MMKFKDFSVKLTQAPSWLTDHKSESIEDTLLRINLWIEEEELIVLNIETLILPSLLEHHEKSISGIFKSKGGEYSTKWYQVFRVWYRAEAPDNAPA